MIKLLLFGHLDFLKLFIFVCIRQSLWKTSLQNMSSWFLTTLRLQVETYKQVRKKMSSKWQPFSHLDFFHTKKIFCIHHLFIVHYFTTQNMYMTLNCLFVIDGNIQKSPIKCYKNGQFFHLHNRSGLSMCHSPFILLWGNLIQNFPLVLPIKFSRRFF